MALIFTILGALWRFVNGGNYAPKHWRIVPALFILPIGVYYGWAVCLAFIFGYVSLLDGFKGWHKFSTMSYRYTGYAALACAFAGTSNWYIVAALVAGLLYPTLHLLAEKGYKLPYFWLFDNYNKYCELVCGAVMIGGAIFWTI